MTGARSESRIQAQCEDGQNLLFGGVLNEDENGGRFIQAAVDLTVPGMDRMVFLEMAIDERPRMLETVTLVLGDNEITLVLLGPHESAD